MSETKQTKVCYLSESSLDSLCGRSIEDDLEIDEDVMGVTCPTCIKIIIRRLLENLEIK